MTENSLICHLISENTDWEQIIYDKNINIRKNGSLAIFNYGPGCDWSDPIVCEARGIIIDTDKAEVVCWPFSKFFNVEQIDFAAKIDWKTARVQEKIDGSIIKLWHIGRDWVFSTNGVIFAEYADVHNQGNFLKLIQSTPEYIQIQKLIERDELDYDLTYIFELTSPENRVVIRYDEPHLWHIGTRNRITGKEYYVSIGIRKPKEYNLHSLDECMDAVKMMNLASDEAFPEHEGFVVVDGNWNRIKIKSPEYLELHATLENRVFSKSRILSLLMAGEDIETFCKSFPEYEVFFRYYQFKLAEIRFKAEQLTRKGLSLYEEYDHCIKDVAVAIKDEPLKDFVFQAIRKGKSVEETFNNLSLHSIENLIPEYKFL